MWLHRCATSSEDGVFSPAKEAICYMAAPESCSPYLEAKRLPAPSSAWSLYQKQHRGPIALGGRSAGYVQLTTSGVSVTSELRPSARLSVHNLGILLGCNTLGWISAYLVCRAVKKARRRALRTRALRAAEIAIDGTTGRNSVAVGGNCTGGDPAVAGVLNAAAIAEVAEAESAAGVGGSGADNIARVGKGTQRAPGAAGSLSPNGHSNNADPDPATDDNLNSSELQSGENNSGNDQSGGFASVKPARGLPAAVLKPCSTVSPNSPLTAPFCDMLPVRVDSSPSKSLSNWPQQDASAATKGYSPVRSRSQSDSCGNAGEMARKGLSRRHSVPFAMDEGMAQGNRRGMEARVGVVKSYDTPIAVADVVETSPSLALRTNWVPPTGINCNPPGPEYFILADSDVGQLRSGGSGGGLAEEKRVSACQLPSTEMAPELKDNARSDCTVGGVTEAKGVSIGQVTPAHKELELDGSRRSVVSVGGIVAEEMGVSPHLKPMPEKERELEALAQSARHGSGAGEEKGAFTNSYTASFFNRLRNLFQSVKPAPLSSQSRPPRDGNDIIRDHTSASNRKSGEKREKNSTPSVCSSSDPPSRISSVRPEGGSPAELKPYSAVSACPLLSAPICDGPPRRAAPSPSHSRPPLPQDTSGAMQGDFPVSSRWASDNCCGERDLSGEVMCGDEKRGRAAPCGGGATRSLDCVVEVTALAAMSPGLASPPMVWRTCHAWRTSVARVKASRQYCSPSRARGGNKSAARSEGIAVPLTASGVVGHEPTSDILSGAAKILGGDTGSGNGDEHDTRWLATSAPISSPARSRPSLSVPAFSETNASGKGSMREGGATADRAGCSRAANRRVERFLEPDDQLQLMIDVGSPDVFDTINAPIVGRGDGSAHSSPPTYDTPASGAPAPDRSSPVARGYGVVGVGSLGSEPPGLVSIPGTNASSFTYSIGSWVRDSEISFFSGPPSSFSPSSPPTSACGVALPEGFTTATPPHGLSDGDGGVASSAVWGGVLTQGTDGGNGGSPHYRCRSDHDTRDRGLDEPKAGSVKPRASSAPTTGINNVDRRGFDSNPLSDGDDCYPRSGGVGGASVDEKRTPFRQGPPVAHDEQGLEAHARPDVIRLGGIGKTEGDDYMASPNQDGTRA